MNEHQLIIAETTYGGRSELEDPKGMMDYGSLIYVALERAKTAREAINVIVDLANTYGYYSSGESFSIADKEEVWVLLRFFHSIHLEQCHTLINLLTFLDLLSH